eukprot:764678-Hanusia_phi.AAC.6
MKNRKRTWGSGRQAIWNDSNQPDLNRAMSTSRIPYEEHSDVHGTLKNTCEWWMGSFRGEGAEQGWREGLEGGGGEFGGGRNIKKAEGGGGERSREEEGLARWGRHCNGGLGVQAGASGKRGRGGENTYWGGVVGVEGGFPLGSSEADLFQLQSYL